MTSNNVLLGSGKILNEEVEVEEVVEVFNPIFLHNEDESVKVTTKEKFNELIAAGYKDHPGKVRKLPGFEYMFEGDINTDNTSKIDLSGKSIFDVDGADIESKIDLSGKGNEDE